MRFSLFIFTGLLTLGACTPPPPIPQSRDEIWQKFAHHSVDEILLSWGSPAAESKLTNGSRLLTYRRTVTFDAASPYERTSGCEASFLASPPHFRIENVSMNGDAFECAQFAAHGPGYARNMYVAPPPPMFYPSAMFYYR
jgi:hypothetical protein